MRKIASGLLVMTLAATACKNGGEEKKAVNSENRIQQQREERDMAEVEKLNNQYPRIPDDKLLDNGGDQSAIYSELKQRYKTTLESLKKEVEATGAKFVVAIVTPEVGKRPSNQNRYGIPFIRSACKDLGIEMYDMCPIVEASDPKVITQVPRDGHWSKKGAEVVASFFAPIIKKYASHKSTVTYKDSERPETFGDLPPNDDEVLDGGKDLPYHLKANSQGLRMDADVTFPKTKQHVLFMGGSQIYSPFLDNEFIATSLLQKQFPDAVIMNSAQISSSLDDYLTLFQEKTKYTEPDLVIVQTNGGDITDLFFTNRNHLARKKVPHLPTPTEEKYYNEVLAK